MKSWFCQQLVMTWIKQKHDFMFTFMLSAIILQRKQKGGNMPDRLFVAVHDIKMLVSKPHDLNFYYKGLGS